MTKEKEYDEPPRRLLRLRHARRPPLHRVSAREVGRTFAERGIGLVYGGGALRADGRGRRRRARGRRRGDRRDPARAGRRRGGARGLHRAPRRRDDARAQGGLHRSVGRLRHAPRRHRHDGRAVGGDELGAARLPRQAGRPAQRGRVLRRPRLHFWDEDGRGRLRPRRSTRACSSSATSSASCSPGWRPTSRTETSSR